ncbi:MAG: Flp pilus assembly complex ATPase component TadA [Clostridia bacterium]|nr:Flp pilus assembly complex ATPase component TadA [Clostridia bacterium]
MRVGVVGRAVLRGGQIDNIKDIDYLAIRVPHLIIGICAPLLARIRALERGKGLLIYSRPGVGKTTVLRDLSLSLASTPYNSKIAVIDSRQEIRLPEMERFPLICFYSGYPKGQAIEAAIRSVSPDFIISDEIGSGNEASALFNAVNSGVSIIATAHAGSKNDAMNKPLLTELIERGAFSLFCGLERDKNNRTSFIFDEDTVSKV